ncbi:MAG: TorF family putative porin [Burkholderiaceae bacterium]
MNFASKSVLVLSTLMAATAAMAQAKAPEPDYTLAYNVGAVSEYRYRGIAQSKLQPALQGGVDFAHKNGFYLGAWGSSIKWIKEAGASDGTVELDIYAGYKGELVKDVAYDVGYLRYEYVGNKLGNVSGFANPNTDELYGALTFGPVTAKYSHSVSNLFGTPDSKGSGYLDVTATFDLGDGWSVAPHVGRQSVKNLSSASYTDYSLTLGKDLGNGLSVSAALLGTDASTSVYTVNGKYLGKDAVVVGAKYSF